MPLACDTMRKTQGTGASARPKAPALLTIFGGCYG